MVGIKNSFSYDSSCEKCYTAEMLYNVYSGGTNQAYINFLLPVLKDVQRVKMSFESNEADPAKLLEDLILLDKSLIRKITVPSSNVSPLEDKIENVLDPKPFL